MYILDFFIVFFLKKKAHKHPKCFAIAVLAAWLAASSECHSFLKLLHEDFTRCHELLVI